MEIATLPFSVFVTILSQVWNTIGIPVVLGTLASGLTQYVKLSPKFLPMINQESTLLTRLFVVACCVILQVLFDLVSHQPVSWSLVHDLVLNYFAASVSYTHLFKPIQLLPATTVQ